MMVLRGDSEKVRSGAKTRPSGTTANTLPRDDDAKGPSSDPAERGEKHCSRQAIRRQSQDDRQMEGPRVYVRRANGPDKSPREHSHAGRRSDHSRLPLAHPPPALLPFGIGQKKIAQMEDEHGTPALDLMRQVKAAFDPPNLFN